MITIDEFKKVEMRVGEIRSASAVEGSDKLLCLMVDFGLKPSEQAEGSADRPPEADGAGERDIRQVLSGIAKHVGDPASLAGKRFAFATNLEPRSIMGLESLAMILAVGGDGETPFAILEAPQAAPGSRVR